LRRAGGGKYGGEVGEVEGQGIYLGVKKLSSSSKFTNFPRNIPDRAIEYIVCK